MSILEIASTTEIIEQEDIAAHELADRLSSEILPKSYWQGMDRAAIKLVQAERDNPTQKPSFGPIFRLDEGKVAAMIYAPIRPGTMLEDVNRANFQSGRIRADLILSGTTSITAINDKSLAGRLEELSEPKKQEEFVKSMRKISKRARGGETKAITSWGGWGFAPQDFNKRMRFVLSLAGKNGSPIDMMTSVGFLGSNHTLNNEVSPKLRRAWWRQARLGMFVPQIEDFLTSMGELIDPDGNPAETISDTYSRLVGHSMGGYLALAYARRGNRMPISSMFKDTPGNMNVVDKPLMVGARFDKEKMPPWMQKVVSLPGYQEHVPLQQDILSMLVRLGAGEWLYRVGLGPLREEILHNKATSPAIKAIFKHYMHSDAVFDGTNVLAGHMYTYEHDPLFSAFCIHLLDTADPIMFEETRNINQGSLSNVEMYFGQVDRTLRHALGLNLAEGLMIPENQVNYDEDGGHYASYKEIMKMAGSSGLYRAEG